MTDPILHHRNELAEQGTEKTPAEVQDWFSDADELLQAFGVDVPPEELVDVIEELKGELPPPDG